MARAHVPMNITEEGGGGKGACEAEEDDKGPLIKYYRATDLIPDKKPRLHRLFNKQPAVWASVQITCGVLSLGLGLVFAVVFEIQVCLVVLFRVPFMTGIMFLFVGFLSNFLYKYPGLLQMCFISNISVLVITVIGTVLLGVDLAKQSYELSKGLQNELQNTLKYKVEILLLCVTLLDMVVSIVLTVFIYVEKHNQEKNDTSS
ncbi:uncharacterized protein LOC143519264 [Brachyhypopomus gauderio]|uniref:uncharacterized protein LOC143519264 n=1 Tax=Brachyhypopomus gauderio TaxID=698409 RepID=UPI004042D941